MLERRQAARLGDSPMPLLPLFDEPDDSPLPAQAARLGPKLRALAERGVYFGTSSWKYEGWLGSIYSPDRYATRGKFSRKKFEETCLAEYARTFPAVCGDFAFYQFPTEAYWARLFGESPAPLKFAFKVPEEITVEHWPRHARYGKRAGTDNPSFLDAGLFRAAFAKPLARYGDAVGPLIFEFGTLPKRTFATPDAFCERLADFLAELPDGFRYAAEVRNPEYLGDRYFDTLARRNVAHVFNAWTRMPEIGDQAAMPGAFTADFSVVRALLRKGRNYEDAVTTFEPYRAIQEPNPAARDGMVAIANRALATKKSAFVFVNNRLEGFARGRSKQRWTGSARRVKTRWSVGS